MHRGLGPGAGPRGDFVVDLRVLQREEGGLGHSTGLHPAVAEGNPGSCFPLLPPAVPGSLRALQLLRRGQVVPEPLQRPPEHPRPTDPRGAFQQMPSQEVALGRCSCGPASGLGRAKVKAR